MRIGFFDSGHGGLDILQAAMQSIEGEYFFIADEKFHPYGALPIDSLLERCRNLTRSLVEEQGCSMVVVACNTATVYAIESLREDFKVPFVGVEPYLNYINHAERELLMKGSVGALVTPNTMRSDRFEKLKKEKDPKDLVHVEAIPELAPAIEAFVSHHDDSRFSRELEEMFKGKDFSAWLETILGCTHYPLATNHLEAVLSTKCISPTPAIVRQMQRVLESNSYDFRPPESFVGEFSYWNTRDDHWREAALKEFIPLPGESALF